MTKNRNTSFFFQLLRYSIGATNVAPQEIVDDEWEQIYLIAQQQSLLGVLFYGIERSGGALRPPRSLLLKWYADSEQIRRENVRANRVAVKVGVKFNVETRTPEDWTIVS